MNPHENTGQSRRGSVCRCVAYQADGQMCGRRAVVMDMQCGGMVCAEHAPGAARQVAAAVQRLSDAWPSLPVDFRQLILHTLAHLPGGADSDEQADNLSADWADVTLLGDLLNALRSETDVVATNWVLRAAEQRRKGKGGGP
jgi:hypothetical protein